MTRRRALALFVCCLLSNTPVFGATFTVNAGGSLQAAIDAAQPGDTIVLQAGATFTGPFTLRAKNGTAYITIRSSTADSQLPPAGTRITPAHAPLLAKIKPGVSGSAILGNGRVALILDVEGLLREALRTEVPAYGMLPRAVFPDSGRDQTVA